MTGPAGVVSVNWQRSTHAEALFLKLGQRKGKREKAYVFLSNYSRGRKREKKEKGKNKKKGVRKLYESVRKRM